MQFLGTSNYKAVLAWANSGAVGDLPVEIGAARSDEAGEVTVDGLRVDAQLRRRAASNWFRDVPFSPWGKRWVFAMVGDWVVWDYAETGGWSAVGDEEFQRCFAPVEHLNPHGTPAYYD